MITDEAVQLRERIRCLEELLAARSREVEEHSVDLEKALAEVTDRVHQLGQSKEAFERQTGVLQSILHSMSDGVVVADENGRFYLFNHAAERILGIGLTDLPSSEWSEQYGCFLADTITPCPTDELPIVKAMRGEHVDEAEIFIRNPKVPEGVWLSVNARPLRDERGEGRGGVVVFRDITARKHAEQRIAVQHAVAQALAESGSVSDTAPRIIRAMCENLDWQVGALWELAPREDRLRCVAYWQAPGQSFPEFELETRRANFAEGRGLPGLVWAARAPQWIADITEAQAFHRVGSAAKEGLRSGFGFPIRGLDSLLGVLELFGRRERQPDAGMMQLSGVVGNLVGQFVERKRAEEALRDSEALYQSLVASLPLFVLRKDTEGRFTFANKRFCDVLRRPLSQIKGKTDADFYPPELAAKYRGDDLQVMQSRGIFEDIEENRHPDGRVTYVQIWKAPVFDARDRVIGVQGVFWDVTDRKKAEQDLRRTAEELKRSNSDLEQFAYVASHDLQEPLRMVSSYCQLLQRRHKDKLDGDAGEFLAYAVDGAKRMQGLINDLLTYSRVGMHGKPLREVNCSDVLQRAVDNLQASIEESQARITADDLPTLPGDETQLVQLFQNLLGNALKFRGERTPEIHIAASADEDHWLFSIRDNGIGIDPQFKERIFVIFQRLHGRGEYPGTGIGLALCKRIVERHGGQIWVESEPGQGCVFYFTLCRAGGSS